MESFDCLGEIPVLFATQRWDPGEHVGASKLRGRMIAIQRGVFLRMASVKCPACRNPVAVSRSMWRSDYRCPHCGVSLQIANWYARLVVLISLAIGLALTWQFGGPRECIFGVIPWVVLLFWPPVAFLILTVLIRVMPYVICPALAVRSADHGVTSLNLTVPPAPRQNI